MPDRIRIGVIDDEPIVCREITRTLVKDNYVVESFSCGSAALKRMEHIDFDVVLCDLCMPEMDGMQVLAEIHRRSPETEVIIATAFSSVDSAIEAIRAGAFHYITKPIKKPELRLLIQRALDKVMLVRDRNALRSALQDTPKPSRMIGNSSAMLEVYRLIEKVAPLECSVLIQGESGTGKEMVARALHEGGPRRDRPFVSFNCGGFTEELICNELFGHERGAFTGATGTKIGLLEAAHRGSIFLDEVEEMPLSMQVKLLRFVEERVVMRVGGLNPISVDVRLIAAGNRDLKQLVAQGRFRDDLFYRLNVVVIHLPPLRDRKGDLPLLIAHFLAKYRTILGKDVRGISTDALGALSHHRFPGNVRELENTIERAVALTDHSRIEIDDLPPELADLRCDDASADSWPTLVELERDYIQRVLHHTNQRRSEAADILDVPRTTLWRKMKRFGMD
jgi:DNA-binding NtrC family response regulator